jgi:radical SAM protein with 4Fe4S-binding SPASM domain
MGRVLFVNLTRLCNVDCPRCYLTPENRKSNLMLRKGLLTEILTSEFFSNPAPDGLPPEVIFQGGEPTIVGLKAFIGYIDEVQRACPSAKMTMVSNLMRVPDWAPDVAHEYFESRIETTWAAGMKKSLTGKEDVFQQRFARSLKKVIDAGLTCPVNVELNRETFDAGPEVILDLASKTGANAFEFDFSVRFDDFRKSPAFGPGNYPVLPASITYAEFRDFVLALRRQLIAQKLSEKISCSLMRPLSMRKIDMAFNTCREEDFLTVNPDGTITSNPLFSDISETYFGSLEEADLDTLIKHPNREARVAFEAERRAPCTICEYFGVCEGGPSHVPVHDTSGECAGLIGVMRRLA